MVELASKGPQWVVGECGAKPTSNVEPTTEVFPNVLSIFSTMASGYFTLEGKRLE